MRDENLDSGPATLELVGEIVAAYVSNNRVPVAEMPKLLLAVHGAIVGLSTQGAAGAFSGPDVEKPSPAQIRKSIHPDGIVSFIDGKAYKSLKRHLTGQGVTPNEYRERYGLPYDYPMVAASYAAKRSELSRMMGLKRKEAAQ